jgi:hypothetical protein
VFLLRDDAESPAAMTRDHEYGARQEAFRRRIAFVAAAVHQRRDHVIEHDPIRDSAAGAAPRVGRGELQSVAGPDQGSQLDPTTARPDTLAAEARTLRTTIRTSALR